MTAPDKKQTIGWNQKTRFRLTIFSCICLLITAAVALKLDKDSITETAVQGMIYIVLAYITGESVTKSVFINKNPQKTPDYVSQQDNIT